MGVVKCDDVTPDYGDQDRVSVKDVLGRDGEFENEKKKKKEKSREK